jgi:hypothetical protein
MTEEEAKKSPYNTFLKYFKKGEQVCISGIKWNTHGYITNVAKEGVWLAQLNNKKEILYPWQNWEVTYHAGVRVNPSTDAEVAHIFDYKIVRYDIEKIKERLQPLSLQTDIDKVVIDANGYCASEFGKYRVKNIVWKDYGNFYKRDIRFELSVGDAVASMQTHQFMDSKFKNLSPSGNNIILSINNQNEEQIITIIVKNMCYEGSFKKGKSFEDVKYLEEIDILRKEGLSAIKNIREEERAYAACDPYIFVGTLIDQQIWATSQGYVMGNPHGEIYV